MVHAYILIQTEVGKAAAVAKEVSEIAGVAEAEDVTGPYDVIVRAEAKSVDELGKLVVAKHPGRGRHHPHAHLPGRPPLTPAATASRAPSSRTPVLLRRLGRVALDGEIQEPLDELRSS